MAKTIRINLDRQTLIASDGAREIFKFDCASGDSAHPTPIGMFSIYRKDRKHFSSQYKVQMDFAMFFIRGVAIHKSHGVGLTSYLKFAGMDSLGSHGCVRLAEEDAQQLFDWAMIGTPVTVVAM